MAGKNLTKSINEIIGGSNKEQIVYNTAESKWQYSNDGVAFVDIGSGGDGYENYVNVTQISNPSSNENYVYANTSTSSGYRKPYGYITGKGNITYATNNGGYKYISDDYKWRPLYKDGFIGLNVGITGYYLYYNCWIEDGIQRPITGTCEQLIVKPVSCEMSCKMSFYGESILYESDTSEYFWGPCFRELATLKMICCLVGVRRNGASFKRYLQIRQYTNTTKYSGGDYYFRAGTLSSTTEYELPSDGTDNVFIKLSADSTTISFYVGYNTTNSWVLIDTMLILDFFTSDIDQVGYVLIGKDVNYSSSFVDHYKVSYDDYTVLANMVADSTVTSFNSYYIEFSDFANYIIDWGDNSFDLYDNSTDKPSHVYSSGNHYRQVWYIKKGDEGKLIDFEAYGDDSEDILYMPNISLFSGLLYVYITNEKMVGRFPDVASLPLLDSLEASGNFFEFPDITGLTNLYYIYFGYNSIVTQFPDVSTNTSLNTLYFVNDSALSGSIPDFSNVSIREIYINSCSNISGSLPNLNSLTNLRTLSCQQLSGITGTLPNLSNNVYLQTLTINNLSISGDIPDYSHLVNLNSFTIKNCSSLAGSIGALPTKPPSNVDLQNNSLTGSIPTIKCSQQFYCNNNQLSGLIPNYTSDCFYMQTFSCNNNQLSGSIPDFVVDNHLWNFNCSYNSLTGSIPTMEGTNIQDFNCSHNQLSGTIPNINYETPGSFSGPISVFDCSYNQLTGAIPGIPKNGMYTYKCNNNLLTGSITLESVGSSFYIQIFDCSNNQISGSIPSLNSLSYLQEFRCNDNEITGADAGVVSSSFTYFSAANNLLTESAVDQILDNFRLSTCVAYIYLDGTGNAAPSVTGQGYIITLQARGCHVYTN